MRVPKLLATYANEVLARGEKRADEKYALGDEVARMAFLCGWYEQALHDIASGIVLPFPKKGSTRG